MSLSPGQRVHFYNGLGQLFEAGFPFLQAAETLLEANRSGSLNRVLRKMRGAALVGSKLSESLAARGMPFSPMEIALLQACENSGKLPQGCQWLTTYFGRLDLTRKAIWRKMAYPLFLLHLGVILQAVPKIFQGTGTFSLFQDIVLPLGGFYLLVIFLWVGVQFVLSIAENSTTMDGVLRYLPVFGGIRRSLAIMRFCNTYVMQLEAGVNIMDCLESAAAASHSATLRKATGRIVPGIRLGRQVGSEMSATQAFPADLIRAMVLGEQTGKLDQEVARVAEAADARALAGIEALGDWIPRILYLIIVGFLAWNMIAAYKDSLGQVEKMME